MKRFFAFFAIVAALLVGASVSGHVEKASAATCGNGVFASTFQYRGIRPSHWRWRADTVPTGLDPSISLQHARNAHTEWELAQNWCGYGDVSNMNFTYDGTGTQSAGCNGVNTIGWGNVHTPPFNLPAADNPLAITWVCNRSGLGSYFLDYDVYEADIRLNSAYKWSNIGGLNTYDVWGVIAHELGHLLGANHVGSTDNIMYIGTYANDLSRRKLGKGEWNFLCVWYSNSFCVPH